MSRSDPPPMTLLVPEGSRTRLDRFLAQHLPGGSRQRARELIVARAVRVNGQRASKALTVHPGDTIHIAAEWAERIRESAVPSPQPSLDVAILYEDEAVVALDKPAGMPSTALRSSDRGTVANFLVGRTPDAVRFGGRPLEGGLAHRLDTDTSGVLLAARSAPALHDLRSQFRTRGIEKTYLALVVGDISTAGTISDPIAHAPRHPRRMIACPTATDARKLKARTAITFHRPLERFGAVTLLEVRMRTGVRHQIRVHLASIGHPLVGDSLYGQRTADPTQAGRMYLHAATVSFRHPLSRQRIIVTAPRPLDFRAKIAELRVASRRRPPGGRDTG